MSKKFLFGIFMISLTMCAKASDYSLCDFNGYGDNPKSWEKIEFNSLIEGDNVSGSFLMKVIIGKIAVADLAKLKSESCNVVNYITSLINFYHKNKFIIQEKHKETSELIELIKDNLGYVDKEREL